MESYTPPIAPPERAPDSEPQKKKLRRVFELFKKPETIANQPLSSPEATPEYTPPTPERRRRLATEIMRIMRDKEQSPTPSPPSLEQLSISTPEEAVHYVATPESLPASLPIVERAKDMGRSVLRLIKRVQGEVQTADIRETPKAPTNVESLAEADTEVRAAMQELIAPIEAYEVSGDTNKSFLENAPASQSDGEVLDQMDSEEAVPSETRSSLVRTIEAATAIATGTAREVLHVKERLEERTRVMRKVGLFALGAATVGGFVYTWKRMRELKKEQRHMRREHKKFEAEVRASQQQEERQLHRLERTKIQKLSQPERQEYVERVSEFAHQQAAEIRTVARGQELLRSTAVAAVVERPQLHRKKDTMPEPQFTVPPERHSTFSLPVERPEKGRYMHISERQQSGAEKAGLIERLSDTVGGRQNKQGGSLTGNGGITAVGTRLANAIFSKQPDPRQQPLPDEPLIAPKKQMQGWPFVAAFCVAAVLCILSLIGVL